MLNALFLIGIGIIIGWHVPTPPWAKWVISFVKTKVQSWLV